MLKVLKLPVLCIRSTFICYGSKFLYIFIFSFYRNGSAKFCKKSAFSPPLPSPCFSFLFFFLITLGHESCLNRDVLCSLDRMVWCAEVFFYRVSFHELKRQSEWRVLSLRRAVSIFSFFVTLGHSDIQRIP